MISNSTEGGSVVGVTVEGFQEPTPNYVNPPSLAPMILAANFASLSLALTAVSLRLWARIGILKKVSSEDYLITISWLLSAFMTACACHSLSRGIGRHWWDIPPEIKFGVPSFPSQYVSSILYTITGCLIKISILLFYLRLSPNLLFRRSCQVTMAFVILIAVGTLPPSIFACKPIEAMWDFKKRLNGGTCIDLITFWNVGAAVNSISDLAILILPLPLIYKSHLPFIQKIHTLILFALGGLLLLASIVRLYNTIEAGTDVVDFTWSGSRSMAWSSIEINTGIIVACLPAVRALLARVCPRFFAVTPTSTSRAKRKQSPAPQNRKRLPSFGRGWIGGGRSSAAQHKKGFEMTSFSTEVYDGRTFRDGYSASVISGSTTVLCESRENLRPIVAEGVIELCMEVDVTIESVSNSRRVSIESGLSDATWVNKKRMPV